MGTPRISLLPAVALVVAGCAGVSTPDPVVPYTAVDARIDGSTLRIRYLSPEGLLYSASTVPDELALRRHVHAEDFPVFVMTPVATARESAPDTSSSRRVPVLPPSEYARVHAAAIRSLAPLTEDAVIVVEMEDGTASLFLNAEGRVESVAGEPPEHLDVVARLPLAEALVALPGVIEEVLADNGIASRDVLFNTGENDGNPWPFVYIDLDASAAAYVLCREAREPIESQLPAGQSLAASAVHVASSHSIGVVQRPVTVLTRVLFMVSDVTRDTIDMDWKLGLESEPIPPLHDGPGMDLQAWEAELDDISGRSASTASMRPLVDGEAFFTRFEEAIANARRSVLLRMYIFDNDDYALRVADLLRQRAADGVDVRVLVDGLGTIGAGASDPAGLPADHVPPTSIQSYLEAGSDVRVRTILNPFGISDHTKTVIIDDEVGFVGGMNIGREYRYEWHDMMVELRGPLIAQLADDFDIAWAGAGFFGDLGELFARLGPDRDSGPPEGVPMRVLYTRPTVSEIRNAQLAAVRRARRYVYVHYAYFSDDTLLLELMRARRRGVDVRVVIPLGSDRGLLARSSIVTANAMFRNGIRVHIFPGMSHVKAVVVDGWACVGSANANELSLRVNLETNVATSAPEAVDALLEALFEADFRVAPEMTAEFPEEWHDPLWELLGDFAF